MTAYLLGFLLGVPAIIFWGCALWAIGQYVEAKLYARKLKR